jgi:hypothetical protein
MLPCKKTAVMNRHGSCKLIPSGSDAPKRTSTFPLIAPMPKIAEMPPPSGISEPVSRNVASKLTKNRTHVRVKTPYVAGDAEGKSRPRDLLAAANENVALAPHW